MSYRTHRFRSFFIFVITSLVQLGCGQQTDPDYIAEIDKWHESRITQLRSDTGWLTLVGLHELNAGVNAVGSADEMAIKLPGKAPALVGEYHLLADGVTFTVTPGVSISIEGETPQAVSGTIEIDTDAADSPTMLLVGTQRLYVIERGERFFVRVKDTDSETLASFTGVDRFPVQGHWRIEATLVPHATETTLAITNALGQVNASPTPGRLVFTVDGKKLSLTPVGQSGESLFIVFGDASNGQKTYGGGRFLSIETPDKAGRVFIDFNKATNPPCVFTPYATCPLPPPENQLSIPITAGEKMWGDHH